MDPLREFKAARLNISQRLEYYAHFTANPGIASPELLLAASLELRDIGMKLPNQMPNVYGYSLLTRFRGYPSKSDIDTAKKLMTQLSNSLTVGTPEANREAEEKIRDLLGLPPRD